LPGYDLGNIILKKGVFTSYSKGMVVELKGMTSHAGHPENGNSPVLAMSNIIQGLISLPSMHTKLGNSANITIIHALLGEIAFGTSPGNAVIRATLRSHESSDMAILEEKAIKLVKGIAQTYDLEYKISWEEIFPSVVNDNVCTDIISNAAKNLNFKIEHQTTAFSWSEDFGFFTEKYKGAFFGFGSGVSHPQLHNPHFDFPDELILPGVEILKEIIIETSKIK